MLCPLVEVDGRADVGLEWNWNGFTRGGSTPPNWHLSFGTPSLSDVRNFRGRYNCGSEDFSAFAKNREWFSSQITFSLRIGMHRHFHRFFEVEVYVEALSTYLPGQSICLL